MKVAPYIVSTRVVKHERVSPIPSSGNDTSIPSLRPIQFFCMVRTRSGHPSSRSISSRSRSAYRRIRKNHCSSLRRLTVLPQRSQTPEATCSFASTVLQDGHQLTDAASRYARPARKRRMNIHCVHR